MLFTKSNLKIVLALISVLVLIVLAIGSIGKLATYPKISQKSKYPPIDELSEVYYGSTLISVPWAIGSKSAKRLNVKWNIDGNFQAAFGTVEDGLISKYNDIKMIPTASTIKVLSVLMLLKYYPESIDDTLVITKKEVNEWKKTISEGGSNMEVQLGQKLKVRDAIKGVLIVSANNIINSLILHYFKSYTEYKNRVEEFFNENNIKHTRIGSDASGFDPKTKTTASDLLKIDNIAMNNQIIREIVKLRYAKLPIIGTVENTNHILFENKNFIGIKTGSTDEAGYCLSFAYKYSVGSQKNRSRIITGVILNDTASNRYQDAFRITLLAKRYILLRILLT